MISIHASRGGSDLVSFGVFEFTVISIHASRGGSDVAMSTLQSAVFSFQSTLPAGEATMTWDTQSATPTDFNPRFPRGKRQIVQGVDDGHIGVFQSTLPAGEATSNVRLLSPAADISIHASRGGSDKNWQTSLRQTIFQSTLPAGEATHLSLCL